ncbi:hypothetical protein AX17_003920 [Amanita inopinata Kibby_2008]|nr:hypothetical protein AX17_003920 [Amanita inopinata Kibby_2008]
MLPPPISKISVEVLAEIFKLCVPILGDVSRPLKDVAPFLLCRVCSSWWTLARSTPELWKSMTIYIPHDMLKDVGYVATFIEGWLGRSGALPLEIYLNIRDFIPKEHIKAILKSLCRYASRWETVYIAHPNSLASVPFPYPLGETSHLPLLRSFYHVSTFLTAEACFPFTSAPRLTRLRWPGALSVSEQPSIPWQQLTLVDCGGLTGYAALEIIQNCPELQEFNFTIDSDSGSDAKLPCRPPVRHEWLRKVCLFHEQNSGPLLDSLILPALDDLRLRSINGPGIQIAHQQLLNLLTRSKCMLKKLALINSGLGSPMLLQCLQHESLSNLIALKITSSRYKSVTDDILLQLTETPSGTQDLLLPRLIHLQLLICVTTSPGILGRMLCSRCCPSKKENRLKTFLLYGAGINKDDKDYINRARRDGLEVVISDYMYAFDSFSELE